MKTLDEVITANECCDHGEPDSRCEDCPYNGIGACCAERETDALQWLKGYRAHIELDKLRDKCETENDPLSWDELRTMEGKPVWVETKTKGGRWMILSYFGNVYKPDDTVMFASGYYGGTSTCYKKNMGITWQAYRREK
jgi:hypothetical protein